jgi:hypothetical protein
MGRQEDLLASDSGDNEEIQRLKTIAQGQGL